MDIIDAAARGDLVVLLATIVVILGGALGFLFRLYDKEKSSRVTRAESLTDRMVDTFDKLEQATTTAVAVARDNADVAAKAADLAQKSLDELRRK